MTQTSPLSQGPDLNDTATELANIILHTQRSWILKIAPKLSDTHLTYPQFFLLCHLSTEKSLAMSNIAKMMGHSTAAATGMVDKLQEMGYIQRIAAVSDRRKIMVKITSHGCKFVDSIHKLMAADLATLLQSQQEDNPLRRAKELLDSQLEL